MKISVIALTCAVALACSGCVTVTNGKGDKNQLSTNGLNKLNSNESNAVVSASAQALAICNGTAQLKLLKQNAEFHDAAYVGYHLEGSKPVISLEKFVQSKTEKFNEFEQARRQQAFETYYSEKQYKDTYYVSGQAELGEYDFNTQSFPLTFFKSSNSPYRAHAKNSSWSKAIVTFAASAWAAMVVRCPQHESGAAAMRGDGVQRRRATAAACAMRRQAVSHLCLQL